MLKGKKLRSADIFISFLFVTLGLYIITTSLGMPWKERGWYTSPGLFPTLLGFALIAFSIAVLIHAFREGGHHKLFKELFLSIKNLTRSTVAKRVILMWLLIIVYVFTLSTLLNYYVGGSVFLFSFMVLLHNHTDGKIKARGYLTIASISILVPLAIGQVFERLFLTPLP